MKDEVKELEKKEKPGKGKHENIYAALSAFQGELKPMEKTGHVQFPTQKGEVAFDYTPLGEIMANIYPLLAKHGLSVRHAISKEGVEAILTHETYAVDHITSLEEYTPVNDASHTVDLKQRTYKEVVLGEIRSGVVSLKGGTEMKDTGAAITYARRYTLTMVLGIASEDDKDAELLEQSGKNAIAYAFTRAKAGVEEAKTPEELEKALNVLRNDLKKLEGGKAPALGLAKDQYEELLELGGMKAESFKE